MAILIKEISSAEEAYSSFLDFPVAGRVAGPSVTLAGWFVLPKTVQNVRVAISLKNLDNKHLSEAAVGERTDVQAGTSLVEGVTTHGYEGRVHGYDLPSTFDLDVWAFYEHGGEAQAIVLASVVGTNRRDEIEIAPEPRLSPVYVIGLARSGTTVLMRMLGAHPAVVCGDKYPMELCVSTFHARLARLAASTADFSAYTKSHLFSEDEVLGPNPFASLNHVDRGILDEILQISSGAFSRAAVEASEAWYRIIANHDGGRRAALFVEKSQPGRALVTALNVYPRARCIVLVRDPREAFLSRTRFNRKRGTKDFGEQSAMDINHWAQMHVEEHRALLFDHEALRDRVVQVIRYEDLMEEPDRIL